MINEIKSRPPKYIICDCAKQGWGKTSTLLEVIYQLTGMYGEPEELFDEFPNNDDRCVLFNVKGVKVAVLTYGEKEVYDDEDPDNKTIEEECIKRIKQEKVKILVCASGWKTSEVYGQIKELANSSNMFEFSNIHADKQSEMWQDELNYYSARSVVSLVKRLLPDKIVTFRKG